MGSKKIAVDFDGVIHEFVGGWNKNAKQIYGPPNEGALEKINLLIDQGFEVVVFTAREDFEPVKRWLFEYGFPELEVTNKKPVALAFIDDRAIRFTNWEDVVKYFI
jgi:hypothetical protein